MPLRKGTLLEVEVADESDGSVSWRPAKVIEILPDGKFKVCVNGDGDFVEEYSKTDKGVEWREPEPSNVAWLEEVYAEGESLFQGQAPPAPAPAAPPKKTTAKKSKKAAADSEADADAGDEKPHFPGDMLEVEVAGSDGSVAWKPAKITEITRGGRFKACINGEGDFIEEYGPEDEGGEWRRVAPAKRARVESAFDKAASAWSKQHRSAADSSMAPLFAPPGDYTAEAILQQRRLPKGRGHTYEYLVKWVGWPAESATWEPEAHLSSCASLLDEFKKKPLNAPPPSKQASSASAASPKKRGRPPKVAAAAAAAAEEESDFDPLAGGLVAAANAAIRAPAAAAAPLPPPPPQRRPSTAAAVTPPLPQRIPTDDAFVDSQGRKLRRRSQDSRQKIAEQLAQGSDDEDSPVGRGRKKPVEEDEEAAVTEEESDDEDEEDDEEEEESDDVMDVDSEDESPKRKSKYSGKNSSTRKQLLRTGSWAPTFCDAAEGARRLKEAASQDANAPLCLPLLLPSLSGLLASDAAEYAAQYPPPPPPPPPPASLKLSTSSSKPPVSSTKTKTPTKTPSPKGKGKAAAASGSTALVAASSAQAFPLVPSDAQSLELPLHGSENVSCGSGLGSASLCNAGAPVWGVAWRRSASSTEPHQLAVGTHVSGASHALIAGANGIQIWEVASGGGEQAAPRMWLEILHPGAGVLALTWAPTGNSLEASADKSQMERLGLLAAACADGRIRVFALPTAEGLEAAEPLLAHPGRAASSSSSSSSAPWRLWLPPVLQLEPQSPALTLTLDWCQSSPHLLAAGLDDGSISVWDLSLKARKPPEWRPPPPKEDDEEGEEGEEEDDDEDELEGPYGRPLGILSVPHTTFGRLLNQPGDLNYFYINGSTLSTHGLGHAGPVRSVRWSPPPNEHLASVGHDGNLYVWEPNGAVQMRQSHQVHPYNWALDAVWAPNAPAIFVATDSAAVRLQPLRDDASVQQSLHEANPHKARFKNKGFASGAAGSAAKRPFAFGCDHKACVWGMACSMSGEKMAGVTSDGRLELVYEEWEQVTKTAKQTYLTGKGVVQIRAVKEEEEGEEDCGLHVSLGKAARVQMPESSAFAPPKVALRSVAWSADEENGELLAAGGCAGLVVVVGGAAV